MKTRCYDRKNKRYKDYGGRGIYVCSEWLNSFETFRDWALVNGFSPDLQLDRANNDGPYAPWNCRWVDVETNANNTRASRIFEFRGERMSISQASRKFGISHNTLSSRLTLYGYTPEEAITVPTEPRLARAYRRNRLGESI